MIGSMAAQRLNHFRRLRLSFFLRKSYEMHLCGFPGIMAAIAHVAKCILGRPPGQAPHLFNHPF